MTLARRLDEYTNWKHSKWQQRCGKLHGRAQTDGYERAGRDR
ncbi:hypothetical protein BSU04_26420 [Caballeronia sordidicola]|uniref:Uncharacterized protein n=1 Tax=Caballeronia sordidicola TaxID=196367 RepID=A0A226WWC3_CABSO|nr:hypothetical protein BSU04_26420 [Caballeronia sordidicola]